MTAKALPDPMVSMWAWLAHDLRFYRTRHKLTGEQLRSSGWSARLFLGTSWAS
jgi:hypothetical protein